MTANAPDLQTWQTKSTGVIKIYTPCNYGHPGVPNIHVILWTPSWL